MRGRLKQFYSHAVIYPAFLISRVNMYMEGSAKGNNMVLDQIVPHWIGVLLSHLLSGRVHRCMSSSPASVVLGRASKAQAEPGQWPRAAFGLGFALAKPKPAHEPGLSVKGISELASHALHSLLTCLRTRHVVLTWYCSTQLSLDPHPVGLPKTSLRPPCLCAASTDSTFVRL